MTKYYLLERLSVVGGQTVVEYYCDIDRPMFLATRDRAKEFEEIGQVKDILLDLTSGGVHKVSYIVRQIAEDIITIVL